MALERTRKQFMQGYRAAKAAAGLT